MIKGGNFDEIMQKFNTLAKNLEIWVTSNGLALNLKKTNYMVFSNLRIPDMSFKPKLFNYEIKKINNARFLGVLISENLTWNNHILALKAKMSRYVGILYKLKKSLPLSVRKNIFHSF